MEQLRYGKKLEQYLKSHNIEYQTGIVCGIPRFTMVYRVENAPGYCVESCIWFYGEAARQFDILRRLCWLTGKQTYSKLMEKDTKELFLNRSASV